MIPAFMLALSTFGWWTAMTLASVIGWGRAWPVAVLAAVYPAVIAYPWVPAPSTVWNALTRTELRAAATMTTLLTVGMTVPLTGLWWWLQVRSGATVVWW